jgi:predicted amidohydrolase YtcJ
MKVKAAVTPKGRWVIGRGYDDTLLKEGRHPTRDDLDRISTEHPIWIGHVSTHLGVANSLALEKAKVTKDTPQPKGGRIRIDPKTGEPNGVFEEAMGMVTKLLPPVTAEEQQQGTEAAVKQYVRQGVTTAVIASGSTLSLKNLSRGIGDGTIPFRVITMTSGGGMPDSREAVQKLNSPLLKTGAVKLLQDGSIQGFTGYLSHPYCTAFEGDPTYRGYPLRSRNALVQKVKELHRAGFQIAIHGNGDAAIDDILFAYSEAQKEFPRPDARHRIEHNQTVREDQLDEMKRLGVTPSYFVGHVYYWGDRHAKLFLGPERAGRISPLHSTQSRGIRFTVHDDTPVTPVNPLQLVWVSVNRLTTSGVVLGPAQRVGVEAALRAVTSDAAWQNFEEKDKGTIEPGKLADFVVLDRSPFSVRPEQIRDISIVQTIVGNRVIYDRNQNSNERRP